MSEIHSREGAHLYAGTRQGLFGIHCDAGEPEVFPFALHDVVVRCLATDAKGILLAAGTRDGLETTRDGGKTWKRTAGLAGEVRALVGEGRTLLAGTAPAALHRSDDGGASAPALGAFAGLARDRWTRALDGSEPGVSALALAGERLAVAVNGGGVLLSSDGGRVLREAPGDLARAALALADAAGDGDAWLAGTSEGLFRIDGAGATPLFAAPERRAVTAVACHRTRPARILIGAAHAVGIAKPAHPQGADSWLYRSDDRGVTWSEAGRGSLPVLRGMVTAIVLSPGDPERVFAGTSSGEVLESKDGGASFHLATATLPGVLALVAGPGRG